MTVKELIEKLAEFPPEARVFEERQAELRELHKDDISQDPSAEGHPIDENEYSDDEWEELKETPIVVFGAWS